MINPLTLPALENLLQERFKEGFLSLKDLPDPSTFKDMERATARIVSAIEHHEQIGIVGDYDVDGVTATTLMKRFFDAIGYEVVWIIPNRFRDGYGISPSVIERILPLDVIITVDNGIAGVEAGKRCQEEGIDLIITDHHLLPPQLPPAYAIIDQKQPECTFPYEEVCGAQIAWYLIASLKRALGYDFSMMPYMALSAIAIIADVMPLQHINRAMVIAGLKELNRAKFPAIEAFLETYKKQALTAEDIAFLLAPLLNSAGRMSDAKEAVAFLLSSTLQEAHQHLHQLIQRNELRKSTESAITKEAKEAVCDEDALIVVWGEEWHEGVLGIVASRLCDTFEKPAIVLSRDENGLLKGSGRSFGMCHLFETLHSSRPLLEKFGGHSAAVGLSLYEKNLEAFKKSLSTAYTPSLEPYMDPDIVGVLPLSEVTFALSTLLERYEPYGEGNRKPKFLSEGVMLASVDRMGKEGEHLRFTFTFEGEHYVGVQFRATTSLVAGERVNIVYTVNENHFRQRVTLQLMIEKIEPHLTH